MTDQRKSVAGKTVPGEKKVLRGPGGKTIPKKDQPTKRQRRLAMVRDPGADGNEKGVVRGEGEYLEWREVNEGVTTWIPAVYHNDIREMLLARASNDEQLTYDHPRKRGHLSHDETAFLASQQHWAPNRAAWHHIPGDLLNRLDRLDYKGRDYELSSMFDEDTGKIVLDKDNHPIVDYEDIPSVLSSNFGANEEGFLLEAIRRIDVRVERSDFLARMPWSRMVKENGKIIPIFTLSTIGNREYRWRKDNAIVSWTQRSGSKNLRAYIIGKLSEDGRTDNTTRELTSGLTKEEIMKAERPNKGAMMSKAGKKLLPDDVREKRDNKSNKRPSKKRGSAKRKASEHFNDDHGNENEEDDQELSQDENSSEAGNPKAQKRKTSTTRAKSLRKRKALANFDDDSDVEDHDSKRIKPSQDVASTASLADATVHLAAAGPNDGCSLKRKREADTREEGRDGEQSESPEPRRLKTGHSRSLNDTRGEIELAMSISTLTSNEIDYLSTVEATHAETEALLNSATTTLPAEANALSSNSESDKISSSEKIGGSGPDEATATIETTPADSSSAHSEPVRDFRFEEPKSFADAKHIEEAMILTRQDFTDLHESNIFGANGPPVTNFWDSYAAQYRVLQRESAYFQDPGLPIVNLDHWGAWIGGFDKWKTTMVSKEGFLQGMKAEDVDANLKQPVLFDNELFDGFEASML